MLNCICQYFLLYSLYQQNNRVIQSVNTQIIHSVMTLFILILCTLCATIHSTLTVMLHSRSTPMQIGYTIANFGLIPYGKQLKGEITIANPMTNCQVEDDIADDIQGAHHNKFLLMMRGDCKFVTKVRNAQAEHAKVAIIMNNDMMYSDYSKIVMAGDGTTRDIQIPSIFIHQVDGNVIINELQQYRESPLKVTLTFPTNKSYYPSLTLFSDVNNRGSYVFMRQLLKYMKSILSRVQLKIFHNFYTCSGSLCNTLDCYPNTTICALPPVGDRVGRGLDLIKQSLRQKFAIQMQKQKGLQYISLIDQHCLDYVLMESCSRKQMQKVGINSEIIDQKMKDTQKVMASLKQSIDMKQSNHIIFYPDVMINGVTYYGEISGLDVFQMLCNSFESPPQECSLYVQNYQPQTKKKSISGWMILSIVVCSLLVFFVVMMVVCRRYIRRRNSRQMNENINQLVSHYITGYETKRIQGLNASVSETEASN